MPASCPQIRRRRDNKRALGYGSAPPIWIAMEKTYHQVPQWLACGFVVTGLVAGGLLLLRTVQAGPSRAPGNAVPQRQIKLGMAQPGSLYAVTIAIKNPEELQGDRRVHVAMADARGTVSEKWLHTADLDFYLTLRPRAPGPVTVTLSAPGAEPASGTRNSDAPDSRGTRGSVGDRGGS